MGTRYRCHMDIALDKTDSQNEKKKNPLSNLFLSLRYNKRGGLSWYKSVSVTSRHSAGVKI